MVGYTAMFVQALVRLLSVAVPIAMIGLACWSPLLAAPQSVADPSDTHRKAPDYQIGRASCRERVYVLV